VVSSGTDWAVVAATLIGPIVAVAITLFIDNRRRKADQNARRHEGRVLILQQLISAQHNPADPMFNAIINLIPLSFDEFDEVNDKLDIFLREANKNPVGSTDDACSSLIQSMMIAVGFSMRRAGQVSRLKYRSIASGEFAKNQMAAMKALPEIEAALGKIATTLEARP
jgi:hypothetical protein